VASACPWIRVRVCAYANEKWCEVRHGTHTVSIVRTTNQLRVKTEQRNNGRCVLRLARHTHTHPIHPSLDRSTNQSTDRLAGSTSHLPTTSFLSCPPRKEWSLAAHSQSPLPHPPPPPPQLHLHHPRTDFLIFFLVLFMPCTHGLRQESSMRYEETGRGWVVNKAGADDRIIAATNDHHDEDLRRRQHHAIPYHTMTTDQTHELHNCNIFVTLLLSFTTPFFHFPIARSLMLLFMMMMLIMMAQIRILI